MSFAFPRSDELPCGTTQSAIVTLPPPPSYVIKMLTTWDFLQVEQDRVGRCPSVGSASTDGNSSASCSSTDSAGFYFTREDIERYSPSRRDGIDLRKEIYLRNSYCTFLQNLGMRLQLGIAKIGHVLIARQLNTQNLEKKRPQQTIATAVVLCHRFFLRQSHRSNDRFIIATSCTFLAAKLEESPRPLNHVLFVAYELRYNWTPSMSQPRFHREMEKQKEIVLGGEQLVLTTLDFELTVHHPYDPLKAVLSRMGLGDGPFMDVAWSFVNDGLRTTLCLQFQPNHIAAGAAFLASKALNIELPFIDGNAWWNEFQTTTDILTDVVAQMLEFYGQQPKAVKRFLSTASRNIDILFGQ